MKFFLDTANVDEIKRINELGLVDGVTTNPTIIAKEGRDFEAGHQRNLFSRRWACKCGSNRIAS